MAVFLLPGLLAFVQAAPAAEKQPHLLAPEVEAFIGEMVQKHGFESAALRKLFGQVQPRPAIIKAISTPGTARPWFEFRNRYIEPARIDAGIAFWRGNAPALERAAREFGIPEEIIVATIGVESFYGRHAGGFRVLDALATLAFRYPPRAELFRSELEEFLLLARDTGRDPATLRGSYAGAMGMPQFLPSSYRRYAIDFDGDGVADLTGSPADAIGSVANYYKAFGWRPGGTIVIPAEVQGGDIDAVLEIGIKPQLKVGELRLRGVMPGAPVEDTVEAALIRVEAASGPRYWLGLNNFYVITRYNRSVNYALTIDELAQILRARKKP